jgi:hypothetical protein
VNPLLSKRSPSYSHSPEAITNMASNAYTVLNSRGDWSQFLYEVQTKARDQGVLEYTQITGNKKLWKQEPPEPQPLELSSWTYTKQVPKVTDGRTEMVDQEVIPTSITDLPKEELKAWAMVAKEQRALQSVWEARNNKLSIVRSHIDKHVASVYRSALGQEVTVRGKLLALKVQLGASDLMIRRDLEQQYQRIKNPKSSATPERWIQDYQYLRSIFTLHGLEMDTKLNCALDFLLVVERWSETYAETSRFIINQTVEEGEEDAVPEITHLIQHFLNHLALRKKPEKNSQMGAYPTLGGEGPPRPSEAGKSKGKEPKDKCPCGFTPRTFTHKAITGCRTCEPWIAPPEWQIPASTITQVKEWLKEQANSALFKGLVTKDWAQFKKQHPERAAEYVKNHVYPFEGILNLNSSKEGAHAVGTPSPEGSPKADSATLFRSTHAYQWGGFTIQESKASNPMKSPTSRQSQLPPTAFKALENPTQESYHHK